MGKLSGQKVGEWEEKERKEGGGRGQGQKARGRASFVPGSWGLERS